MGHVVKCCCTLLCFKAMTDGRTRENWPRISIPPSFHLVVLQRSEKVPRPLQIYGVVLGFTLYVFLQMSRRQEPLALCCLKVKDHI